VADRLLLDTDVLIDYLRDRPEAVAYLENLEVPLLISVITGAELYAGVRDGAERSRLDRFTAAFQIVPLDQEIAIRGGLYRRDYGKSHNLGLADALVGATAATRQAALVILNRRHYPMLADLVVPYAKASA